MSVRDVANRHYLEQQAAARTAVRQTSRIWRDFDPNDLDGSYRRNADRLLVAVSTLQLAAADGADRYVDQVLVDQGAPRGGEGTVRARALAGVASDGRPLDTLLYEPVIATKKAVAQGATTDRAMARGQASLAMLAATQVQDVGRLAVSIAMTVRPQAGGYRRQLNPPSCDRCVILAGAWYRWNTGFQRHPSCDCRHVVAVGPKSDLDGIGSFDPNAYFGSLDEAAQDRIFTKAGAQAIRDGADMGQVVNARRGMKTTAMYGRNVTTTTVGTTARQSSARRAAQVAGNTRRRGRTRLMPEQIYADARDRDHAIELLRTNGFI